MLRFVVLNISKLDFYNKSEEKYFNKLLTANSANLLIIRLLLQKKIALPLSRYGSRNCHTKA
jgi:hypothetical protein